MCEEADELCDEGGGSELDVESGESVGVAVLTDCVEPRRTGSLRRDEG